MSIFVSADTTIHVKIQIYVVYIKVLTRHVLTHIGLSGIQFVLRY
jgi:hypothetical protein